MLLTIKQWEKLVSNGAIVIDAREKVDSEQAIVPESLCIPYGPDFTKTLKALLTLDRKMVLISEKGNEEKVGNAIIYAGFSNYAGCLKTGFNSWIQNGSLPDFIINITAEEFGLELKYSETIICLDIRPTSMQSKGLVAGAIPIQLKNIYTIAADLETDKRYILYSDNGIDSFTACSVLHSLNMKTAINVINKYADFASEDIEITQIK